MNQRNIRKIITDLKNAGIQFEAGLSEKELEAIESKFEIRFPSDLRLLYKTAFPISENFVRWRFSLKSDAETNKIKESLNWPLEGMLFDIENNVFWREDWGIAPKKLEEKIKIAKSYYKTYPKLIPIYAHRYIPETPSDSGNPIFSVHQMDIIYYGNDLKSYFANEFRYNKSGSYELEDYPKKKIEFWSSVVEDYDIDE